MTLLLDSIFASVAWGHLIVDVLNGQRTVLLTFWSNELGMSNTTLALISTIYVWGASLSQPFFGWIADRRGTRWLSAGGILWMTGFFCLALFLPVEWAIPCLILASLGSAAFHPSGTTQATLRGQTRLSGHETTAASWFFLFGQFGYFFGPIVGGPLLDMFGPTGLLILAAPALIIGLNAGRQLRHVSRPVQAEAKAGEGFKLTSMITGKRFLLVLALVAALQAWAQQNMITFLPKYLSDLGLPARIYGLFAGIFMGGSAIGNVIGGYLADHFPKQRVAMVVLTLAATPLVLISMVGWSPWLYLLVPLAGTCTGAVHSIIVVLAQKIIRGGMALASGLILGFMFSAGALGTLVSGRFADSWGFPPVFQFTAGMVLLAAFLTIFLRDKKTVPEASPSLP